jgi:hypothetical protein
MYYFLSIEQQLKRILGKLPFKTLDHQSDDSNDLIGDIRDGDLYKKLLDSEDGSFFKKKEALTFLINTDGASICQKSKLTIWPVYLTINELPSNIRFAPENVILAG